MTLIRTATGKAFKTVKFTGFSFVWPVAFTPDSKTAYIVNDAWSGTVFPIQTRTGHLGRPIHVGHANTTLSKIKVSQLIAGVAFTPDGRFLYIGTKGGMLIPVRISTSKRGKAIHIRGLINTFVIAPSAKLGS